MNRYSFQSEQQAKELITKLLPKDAKIEWNKLTVSEHTHGLQIWGFEDKYSFDAETKESVLIEKGLTFNVDVVWKDTPPIEWDKYEVTPTTPSHT
jgi:hypothetical protein